MEKRIEKIKTANTIAFTLFIGFVLVSVWFEYTNMLYGDLRFKVLTALYSLGLLLGVISFILFIIVFKVEERGSRFRLALLSLLPMFWLLYHSIPYYKDLFTEKAVFQSEVFFVEDMSFMNKGKIVSIEYEDELYELEITDEIYDYFLGNDPFDDSNFVYFKPHGVETLPHKYPAKIVFYKNTGIVCDAEILKP